MKVFDNFKAFCYPLVGYQYDAKKLHESVVELLSKVGITEEHFTGALDLSAPAKTFNLTHIKGLEDNDRWDKYKESHSVLRDNGIRENDFTEFLSELEGLYIKEVIDEILKNHYNLYKTKFVGRCQLMWSQPRFAYSLHRDMHTKHRYHIPVYTDPEFFWLFEKDLDYSMVHMPADGRVWYVNPRDVKHTVMHLGRKNRLHILLTSAE
jgi:hypothetical protein